MGVTEAIVAMVAVPAARDRLAGDPEAFRREFGLTAAEVDMLRRASPHGFHLAGNEHRTARLETLQAILPRTLRLLRPAPSARLGPYMDEVPWQARSIRDEARSLLRWLRDHGGLDPDLADLARYETTIHELAEDPAATRHAAAHQAAPGDEPLAATAATDRPILSPAARIASFDHDVTATPPTPRDRPLHLLAVKTVDRWGPRIYRLSDEAAALLLRCDGRRTVAELAAEPVAELAAEPVADPLPALDRFAALGALSWRRPVGESSGEREP